MGKFEKLIRINDLFEFEIQKFIDVASNIKDDDLRIRLIAQMIRCQKIVLKIIEEE